MDPTSKLLDLMTRFNGSLADYGDMREIIVDGADVNAELPDGHSMLTNISLNGKWESSDLSKELILGFTMILIENGADINHRSIDGCTALHNAYWNGNHTLVDLLVRCGADLDMADVDGEKPADSADKDYVQVPTDNPSEDERKDMWVTDKFRRRHPILKFIARSTSRSDNFVLIASSNGCAKVLEKLIDGGLYAEPRGVFDNDPLSNVCKWFCQDGGKNYEECFRVLLSHGANPCRVFGLICGSGQGIRLARQMFGGGDRANIIDPNSSFIGIPFTHIAMMDRNDGILRLLLNSGASLDSVDTDGNGLLHAAHARYDINVDFMVYLILSHGCAFRRNDRGLTPFEDAARTLPFGNTCACLDWFNKMFAIAMSNDLDCGPYSPFHYLGVCLYEVMELMMPEDDPDQRVPGS